MPKPNEKEAEKVLIEPVEEEAVETVKMSSDLERWQPKTELGKKVKSREITNIDQVLDTGKPILEPEIVDMLLPGMENDLLMIGQSKGSSAAVQEEYSGRHRRRPRKATNLNSLHTL